MRINDRTISGANLEICIIPRGNAEDIIFKCQAVLDMTDFEKLCPPPKIPIRFLKDNKRIEDVEDPVYKGQLDLHNTRRFQYLILKSLEATPGLEWDTVKLSDPSTWDNYETELRDSGISSVEMGRIIRSCFIANCLDEKHLDKSRESFLAITANPESS